jgi:type II secretory pathway pseudopilin PulG
MALLMNAGPMKGGLGRACLGCRASRRIAAFTLAETVISLGIMGILVAACLSAILFSQVSVRKAKEEAIGMDFLTHYAEIMKALPFTSVVPGLPINSLFDGVNGAPLIIIPQDNSWVPLDTTEFQIFHPDLLWLSNRNPKLQVTLTKNNFGGVLHDLEVSVKIAWDPPLAKGGRMEVQVDFLRTKDVTTL